MSDYDSTQDTRAHIETVRLYLQIFARNLTRRGEQHDASKLYEPEKSLFDKWTPLLAKSEYGSPEYNEALEQMRPALQHHYKVNSHHPEYYPYGVNDMTLFDIAEMLCDWKAATERHETGSMAKSIEINAGRYLISPQLKAILINTAKIMGWYSPTGDE